VYLKIFKFKNLLLNVFAASAIVPFGSGNVLADYNFSAPSNSWGQTSTSNSSFDVHSNSMSCSHGSGTPPSIWIGAQNGNGRSHVIGSSIQDDDVFTGGIALNIPLGSGSTKGVSCERLLTIMEAEEFIQMISTLNEIDGVNKDKSDQLIRNYLESTGERLGIDFKSVFDVNTAEISNDSN
jgi:hypothetical protein